MEFPVGRCGALVHFGDGEPRVVQLDAVPEEEKRLELVDRTLGDWIVTKVVSDPAEDDSYLFKVWVKPA